MLKLRILAIACAAVGTTGLSWAQINGPVPLSWRWAQSTQVAPLGKPLVKENRVFVSVGPRVFCLDKDTGNQLWRFPVADPIDGNFRSTPVFADGLVVAVATNKQVFGLDPESGAMKWQYIAPVAVMGDPVAVNDKFVGLALSDNSVQVVEAANGKNIWENPQRIFSGIVGGMASYGTNLLIQTGDNKLISKSVTTQKTEWEQRFSLFTSDTAPTVVGDTVYVHSGQWLVALNAARGTGKWQKNLGSNLTQAPAVTGDVIASMNRDGVLFTHDTTGRPYLAKGLDLKSPPAAAPSSAGELLAVPTSDGALNLINPKTGDIRWSYLVQPMASAASTTAPGMGGGGIPGGGRAGGGAAGGGRTGGGGMIGGGGGMPGMGGGMPGMGRNTQTTETKEPVKAAGAPVLAGETLFLLAQDGSLLAFDGKTGVDLTPPTIEMVWPSQGSQVSGQPPLDLIFKIEDASTGVNGKSIKIMVGNTPMDYEYGRDGYAIAKISALGKNKPLENGRQTIVVTVSDWFGNESKATYTLFIDNTLAPLTRPTTNTTGTGGIGGPGGGRTGGAGGGRTGGGGRGGGGMGVGM